MNYADGPFVSELCSLLALSSPPTLVRSNTNLIYDCGDVFLRLTPNAFRPIEDVTRELRWLGYVGARMENVVRVVGDDPTETTQFVFGEESFTVTRFERMVGRPVEKGEWGPDHFERLGALTGTLHRLAQDYSAPEALDLHEWDRVPEACLAQNLPDDVRELPALNLKAYEYMRDMPRNAESYGPIHYDLHAGNYLIAPDGRLMLFDFENSCRAHNINDIAVALYYARLSKFSGNGDDFDALFLESFWKGYEKEYTVPAAEVEAIPWLLLNRSLILYGYLHKIWLGEWTNEQQEYADRVERGIVRMRSELGV